MKPTYMSLGLMSVLSIALACVMFSSAYCHFTGKPIACLSARLGA